MSFRIIFKKHSIILSIRNSAADEILGNFTCKMASGEWSDFLSLGLIDKPDDALVELANTFFISKFYMTRVFKEQFGVSINSYLLQIRITKAKQMLRFSDEKIEAIGYQCGFSTPNYFTTTFKNVEGITPSEYREKW